MIKFSTQFDHIILPCLYEDYRLTRWSRQVKCRGKVQTLPPAYYILAAQIDGLPPSQPPAIVEAASNIKDFLGASMSENTRRAYADLWQRFSPWCETMGASALPALPEVIAAYLAHLAKAGKKAATVNSARAAIRKAHEAAGLVDPTNTPLV